MGADTNWSSAPQTSPFCRRQRNRSVPRMSPASQPAAWATMARKLPFSRPSPIRGTMSVLGSYE